MIKSTVACVPIGRPWSPAACSENDTPVFAREMLATPILIVEDEAMIAWMLESLLEDIGFETIALAPSANDAIETSKKNPPGLIISDINLGDGIDGIDAATTIIEQQPTPAIFVTGYADHDARERIARVLPGSAILRKPIQTAELRQAVLAALQARDLH